MYLRIYQIGKAIEFTPEIEPGTGEIKCGDKRIHLHGQEYRALKLLPEAEGWIVVDSQLVSEVFRDNKNSDTKRLPNLVNRVRDSLAKLKLNDYAIRKDRDLGYYLKPAKFLRWSSGLSRPDDDDLRVRFWRNLCTTADGLTVVFPIHELYRDDNGRLWTDRDTALQNGAELCLSYTGVGELA